MPIFPYKRSLPEPRRIHQALVLLADLILFILWCPQFAIAATLSIDPPEGNYGPGDALVLTIRLDTDNEECVNAARVELHYPTDWMKAVAVSKGESFFSLWAEEPQIDHDHGLVTFEGGIPAGYCGRIQGDPGKTDVIARVVFSIPGNMIGGKIATGPEPLPVFFGSSTQVLLNDGFGSTATLTLKNGKYIRTMESQGMKNEWLDIVHGDTTPPEPFHATVESDPKAFQGRYFLVFSTVDKQSGVDHYEVMENDPLHPDQVIGKREKTQFVSVASPYVLVDQSLSSRITVRAIDHAGNVQEVILPPKNTQAPPAVPSWSLGKSIFATLVVALLVMLGWWWSKKSVRPEIGPSNEAR